MARKPPIWHEGNLHNTEGVGALERRDALQQGPWEVVSPQPKVMIVVVDEADPHANEKNSYSGQYGVLYVLRTDEVKDKDRFTFLDPDGQKFFWGVVGQARWNIDHALTRTNYGVKQFRIRKGG